MSKLAASLPKGDRGWRTLTPGDEELLAAVVELNWTRHGVLPVGAGYLEAPTLATPGLPAAGCLETPTAGPRPGTDTGSVPGTMEAS